MRSNTCCPGTRCDPQRVGITGASGGGYNTWITAAIDDRIAAAVPVVGTSEFGEQIHVCRPRDWYQRAEHCHFVPGLIRYANNHEMLAMAAPKPLLIIAAVRDDSFPVEGVRAVAKYGQMLYDAYGAGDRIGLVDDSGKESLGSDPVIAEASDKGWAVCGVDRRGIGESSSAKTGWIFAVSLLLGENFVGRQAFDVQRVIDTMATTDAFAGKPIDLYGRGTNSSLMAVYAMARLERDRHRQTPLKWFLLRDEYLSYRAFVERPRALLDSFRLMPADGNRTTSFDREIPPSFFVLDVLRSWDLRHLLASSGAQRLIVNTVDGDGSRLSEHAALRFLPRGIRVVSAGHPDQAIKSFLRSVLAEEGIRVLKPAVDRGHDH